MQTIYHGNFGNKTKSAVQFFVRTTRQEKGIRGSCEVLRGPEGQVLILVPSNKSIIPFLSRLSAKTLEQFGVWLVGLPKQSKQLEKAS